MVIEKSNLGKDAAFPLMAVAISVSSMFATPGNALPFQHSAVPTRLASPKLISKYSVLVPMGYTHHIVQTVIVAVSEVIDCSLR